MLSRLTFGLEGILAKATRSLVDTVLVVDLNPQQPGNFQIKRVMGPQLLESEASYKVYVPKPLFASLGLETLNPRP